jgi:hypothetical protein
LLSAIGGKLLSLKNISKAPPAVALPKSDSETLRNLASKGFLFFTGSKIHYPDNIRDLFPSRKTNQQTFKNYHR